MSEWKSASHNKYLLQYHLIFVCKYRKKLLVNQNIADDTYDKIKRYLALDVYGASAVDDLIAAEYRRCREQKTLTDTSDYTINISFKPDNIH